MFLATRSACKFYFVQATMPGNVPSEIKEDRDSDSPKKSDSQHYKQSHLITMEVYFFFKISISFILPPNKTWIALVN